MTNNYKKNIYLKMIKNIIYLFEDKMHHAVHKSLIFIIFLKNNIFTLMGTVNYD